MSQPLDHPPMASAAIAAATISNQLMIALVLLLFVVVAFVGFLYLYAKHHMGSNPATIRHQIPPPRCRGLNAEVLKSLPITTFNPSGFKDGIECAVCLSELCEGEEVRILPKCNHGFHVKCIDMWLRSHVTCPLCRAPVTAVAAESLHVLPREGVSANGHLPEFCNCPANMLFQEGASSSKRPEEERTPARLRSFRRMLSRGKMVIGSSCSPRGGDIEQGVVTPKNPAS